MGVGGHSSSSAAGPALGCPLWWVCGEEGNQWLEAIPFHSEVTSVCGSRGFAFDE